MPRLLAGSSGAASTSSLFAHIQGRNEVSRDSTGSLMRGVSNVPALREAKSSFSGRGACGQRASELITAGCKIYGVQRGPYCAGLAICTSRTDT